MKAGGLVILASAFYVFMVFLFWPIERQILPASIPSTDRSGYQHRTVKFSDTHVAVRIPTTAALQELGLGGVTELDDDEGMMWALSSPRRVAFWMKGMLIPLDFIWIRENQVISLSEHVPAPTSPGSLDLPILDPGVPVDSILEVADGFIQRHTIRVGDVVRVDPAPY